jgi:hypothetical protein
LLQFSTEDLVKEVENSIAEFKRHKQEYNEERVEEQVSKSHPRQELKCSAFSFPLYFWKCFEYAVYLGLKFVELKETRRIT